MHEKDSSFIAKQCSAFSSPNVMESDRPFEKTDDCGMASLWNDIVLGLERSVENELLSDNSKVVAKALRSLRQFVVGSSMNKSVVSNSAIIRPRLLQLLCRFRWWSLAQADVCVDICGLVNSLVRDCPTLSEHILSNSDALTQLVHVALDPATLPEVREACSLLLRTLFCAEGLSSVLSQATPVPSRRIAALSVFPDETLVTLLTFLQPATDTGCSQPRTPHSSKTTSGYLMQLLALLSTDPDLAARLHQLNALQVCHSIIMATMCTIPNCCLSPNNLSANVRRMNRKACIHATDPSSHLLARFALKLMVHLLFHVERALETFQQTYQTDDPLNLIACYGHLLGSLPPNISVGSPRTPPGYRSRWLRKCLVPSDSDCIQSAGLGGLTLGPGFPSSKPANHLSHVNHAAVAVSTCAPSSHGTQALVGLLRGVLYWRMVTRSGTHVVDAVDQFGTPVTSTAGFDLTSDDVALLVIQPLTDSCLHTEDIRILSWICHVLVLVLDDRPELHLCSVYTNSFIREIDGRVTSVINAVQEASNSHNHVQFIEHLIPLVKLFACLASSCESIRVLFSEVAMCSKLIDFTLRLKPIGLEHTVLFLEFQHSIAVLLHVLSRSIGAHHTFFRNEDTANHLINLIEENLLPACRGRSLCAGLVEAASGALVNIVLPMSPTRQSSPSLFSRCMAIFIRLIQISEQPRTSTSSSGSEQADCSLPESTSDLRSCRILTADRLNHTLNIFRLNGIWGLANLLHSATASACTDVFDRLVTEKAWLELVRPIPLNCNLNRISSWPRTIDAQFHPIQSVCSSPHQPSKSAPPSPEDPKIKQRVPSPRSSDLSSLPEPERSNALPASNEAPHLTSSSQCVPAVHEDSDCRQRHTPQRGHIEDDDDTHSIQTTMIYYTLSLLRNLLRHRRVIDAIIKNHWWNIAQLLISVLEGGYPQPVKEQAILVLAHIANGQSALEQLRLNQDMIEKLKLFMRSPDSYTKAAALIATYHVLGLGRENMDSSLLLGSRRDLGEPFFISFHHRMRHRHNCHRDRYKHRYETAHSIPGSSTTSDTHRRHLLSSVTQSLLEEAGEHEEEDYEEERTEEKHDFAIGHTSNTSVSAYEPPPPDNTRSSRSQDCLVSFTEREETSVVLPNPTDSSPPLTFRDQDPSLSASPVSEAPESRHAQIEHPACIPLQRSVSHYRTLSTESSTSSDSSASCGEQLMTTSIDLADLDRTTAQDLLGSSPPTDSETELKALSPAVNEELEGISELSQCSGTRAPLAAQERMDEFESSLGSTAVCHQTHCENDPTNARINHMGSAAETNPNIYTKTSSEIPSSTQVTTDTNSTHTRRSRRDWEIGFHQVLFPFLRELESDTILRSTWDWLMMRAFTRGKPIQLHDLFVAWQRLYDTIPPDSFNTADSESLCLDSSLFTDCPSIDVFLRRLRENIGISSSTTSRVTTEGSHPPRRRHHHRHRHRLSAYPRHSPVLTNESNSTARDDTPLPPPLSDSEPNQGPTGLEQCPSGALS